MVYVYTFYERISIMKKIASAVLLMSVVTANATVKEHFQNNWGKYTAGTVTTAAAGAAAYYDVKYNNAEILKEAKKLVLENPKAAAGIVSSVLLASTGYYGYKKNIHGKTWIATKNASTKVKDTTVNAKNKVKSWFSKGISIDTLELKTTIAEALKDAGYKTVEQIRKASDTDLLAINTIGEKSLDKIREATSVEEVVDDEYSDTKSYDSEK